jgi:hypothetical protein
LILGQIKNDFANKRREHPAGRDGTHNTATRAQNIVGHVHSAISAQCGLARKANMGASFLGGKNAALGRLGFSGTFA